MLWAIEFPSSQSVDEREHSVGEAAAALGLSFAMCSTHV